MRNKHRLAAAFAALFAWAPVMSPAEAADDLTRDQVIDAMINLTQKNGFNCAHPIHYAGDTDPWNPWNPAVGDRCRKLGEALPRFFKEDADLFLESMIRVDCGNRPLHRLVMVYRSERWDWSRTPTWELQFQIGPDRYPMLMQCQPDSLQQFRCRGTEGVRYAEDSKGFRLFTLILSRR